MQWKYLCMLSILLHRLFEKCRYLIRLIIFTASSRVFLNETGVVFYCKCEAMMSNMPWRLPWFMPRSEEFYPPLLSYLLSNVNRGSKEKRSNGDLHNFMNPSWVFLGSQESMDPTLRTAGVNVRHFLPQLCLGLALSSASHFPPVSRSSYLQHEAGRIKWSPSRHRHFRRTLGHWAIFIIDSLSLLLPLCFSSGLFFLLCCCPDIQACVLFLSFHRWEGNQLSAGRCFLQEDELNTSPRLSGRRNVDVRDRLFERCTICHEWFWKMHCWLIKREAL